MVLDAIFDFIKEKVIIAGVTWIIGLLNPASAFFKACKAIYDIVMFFVEPRLADPGARQRGDRLDRRHRQGLDRRRRDDASRTRWPRRSRWRSASSPACSASATSAAPSSKTIEKAQAPVNKAIDWVINGAVKVVKAAGNLVKGLVGGKKKEPEARAAAEAVSGQGSQGHCRPRRSESINSHARKEWHPKTRCRQPGRS